MREEGQFIAFSLDAQRYALPLASVERVIRVVEITPLSKALDIVLGVVNVQGRVIPVINLRGAGRPALFKMSDTAGEP